MTTTLKNKHDAILAAALDLFADNGFHCAPISQVAAMAGVGVGSIYRYFKDKDELVHAVFAKVDDSLLQSITTSKDPTLSGRCEFIHLVTALIHYLDTHPQEYKFFEQYYNSPYGLENKRAKFLQENIADKSNPFLNIFSDNKNCLRQDLTLPVYLAMTFGPVSFLLRESLSGLVTLDEAMIQQTAEASWNAIKA